MPVFAVSVGPLHGYGILLRIQQISGDRLEIAQESFYIVLYRIEHKGWIEGEWASRLKAEMAKWSQMIEEVSAILAATPEQA